MDKQKNTKNKPVPKPKTIDVENMLPEVEKSSSNFSIQPELKVKLKDISKKLEKSYEEISKLYITEFQNETNSNKNNWPTDVLERRVLNKIRNSFKRLSMTKTYLVEGPILGFSQIRDMNSKIRQETLKKFDESSDMKYILTRKVVNIDGSKTIQAILDDDKNVIPIDWREKIKKNDGGEFNNLNYNKEIPKNLIQNVFGIFDVIDKDSKKSLGIRAGILSLRGDSCNYDIPLNQIVSFEAILVESESNNGKVKIKQEVESESNREKSKKDIVEVEIDAIPFYKLNSTINTILKPTNEETPRLQDIVKNVGLYTSIANLIDFDQEITKQRGQYNTAISIIGNVLQIFPQNQNGNISLIVDDDSLVDYEFNGESVTEMRVIVQSHLEEYIDFDYDSIVVITGTIFFADKEKFPMFMAQGIYAIPEFKTLKHVEDADLDIEIEEQENNEIVEEEIDESLISNINIEDLKE